MANKMLIDTTHPEETRVVVLRGNRVEEFDFESANRRQLRGNIYLAKVTRVEPSLQAAFVDYGGNRHGFLAFSEIHPDYYQIPVADRQALIAEEERAHRDAEDEIDRRASGGRRRQRHEAHGRRDDKRTQPLEADETSTYPADLTPALQETLAILADLETYYDGERQKLERWSGPEVIKQRLSEQLEARRQREREPFLRRLAGLQQQIRSTALFKARPVH